MENNLIPFLKRKVDWIFVGFFLINLFFITYIVDIEQIIISDPHHFHQPFWPPATPHVPLVFGLNLPWLLVPLLLTARRWKEHPFS